MFIFDKVVIENKIQLAKINKVFANNINYVDLYLRDGKHFFVLITLNIYVFLMIFCWSIFCT